MPRRSLLRWSRDGRGVVMTVWLAQGNPRGCRHERPERRAQLVYTSPWLSLFRVLQEEVKTTCELPFSQSFCSGADDADGEHNVEVQTMRSLGKQRIGLLLSCLGLAALLADYTREPSRKLPVINSFTASAQVLPSPGNGITISPAVPADIPGGAPSATLEDAAVFAWQEFIALNWPAVTQTGSVGNRETPDTTKKFGEVDPTLGTPLVWETFRHKVEIYPGSGTPHGGANYDALPQYVYNTSLPTANPPGVGTSDGQVLPCDGADPNTPWNNLDEQSEIGLDQMFAGAGPGGQFTGQQILYEAKANRMEYDYVFQNGWYVKNSAPAGLTVMYLQDNQQSPPPGDTDHVSFLNGTIELKAAWRQLTATELASGRFHTAMVRYYRVSDGCGSLPATRMPSGGWWRCTSSRRRRRLPTSSTPPSAKSTTSAPTDGASVEDENGNLIANQTADPLDPMITSQNAVSANPPTPSSVQTLTPATAHDSPPTNLLYYENTPTLDFSSEPQGLVYVNRRIHSIPATVIDVNQTAHEAIMAYNQANNLSDSPWLYYKLVNVQWQPIDKPTPGVDYTAPDAATYYQANIVVETDYNLQVFSGRFQQGNQGTSDDPSPGGPIVFTGDPTNPSRPEEHLWLDYRLYLRRDAHQERHLQSPGFQHGRLHGLPRQHASQRPRFQLYPCRRGI